MPSCFIHNIFQKINMHITKKFRVYGQQNRQTKADEQKQKLPTPRVTATVKQSKKRKDTILSPPCHVQTFLNFSLIILTILYNHIPTYLIASHQNVRWIAFTVLFNIFSKYHLSNNLYLSQHKQCVSNYIIT